MDFDKVAKELNTKYKDIDVRSIRSGDTEGSVVMEIRPSLAYLEHASHIPREFSGKVSASVVYKDILTKQAIDLARKDFDKGKPHKLYQIVNQFYWDQDIFGSYIDTLVYFAASGFHNDCKDEMIKSFYDHWGYDTKIRKTLDQIFLEYFRTGFVRTYRVLGPYEPQVSTLPPVKRKMKSKGNIPIAYQILNPLSIEIIGTLWLKQTRVTMPIDEDMKALVSKPENKLTEREKILLKNLPSDVKMAIKEGKDIVFDPNLIGAIDYMKMDYERYPMPLGTRAFNALDYKKALQMADYSAVDGVTHEILKVTIGNDMYPVTDPNQLEAVVELFNTPSKAFATVWNHTLDIERIEAQNIDKIFGRAKFDQVSRDISGSFGILRPLIDGIVEGDSNAEALKLGVKSVIAKLNYARRDVADWLEGEYKYIAEVNKFNQYPAVRFDDMELRDELLMMNMLQGFADRRFISYKTIQEKLGFDHDYEVRQMTTEKKLVDDGVIGLTGSPYQQSKDSAPTQETQKTPKGTPSEGRPKNKVSPSPKPSTPEGEVTYKTKTEPKRKAASINELQDMILNMDEENLEKLQGIIANLAEIRKKEQIS